MAYTKMEICSNALIRLGAAPIQSFVGEGDISTACENIYDMKVKYILNSYPWRFTLGFAQLSKISTLPSMQWKYKYNLPPDRIQDGLSGVYLSTDYNELPFKYFELIGDKLFCNEEAIWVKYQKDINEEDFPPYFTELMVGVMMVEIAFLVTDSVGLMQELKLTTYGTPSEHGVGGLTGTARQIDSRDTPTVTMNTDLLLAARFGSV